MPGRSPLAIVVLIALCVRSSVQAGAVFLDYGGSGFETRLNTNLPGGYNNFTAGQVSTIQANIKSGLETAFTGFTALTFTETDPGGVRDIIDFDIAGGGLGLADHIDFLNRDKSDTARVFASNWSFVLDEFAQGGPSIDPTATMVDQISTALTGTAAHELGHNLGLRHHDSHGNLVYDGSVAAINTGGIEDTQIMATGSTGLTEAGRETERTFSLNSVVKLEYADGTLPSNPQPINEIVDAGATIGTATDVTLEALPVSGRFGEVIIGTIGNTTDVDVFRIDQYIAGTLTADINIDYDSGTLFNNVNTMLRVLDSTGTPVASSIRSSYTSSTYGNAGAPNGGPIYGESFDPAVLNFALPSPGTYYIEISPEGLDTGDYQLLIHTSVALANGDVDGDGDVDFEDFLALQIGFGETSGADRTDGDLDGDGDVDFEDFLVLQSNFGSDSLGAEGDTLASAATVPEPSTIALALAGLLLCFGVRRRT